MAKKKPTPRYADPDAIKPSGYLIMAGLILLGYIAVILWG